MKSPTSFSRIFIQTVIEHRIADPSKLRDYDILSDHKTGMSMQQIANKHGLSKRSVLNIIHKYR